MVPSAAEIAAQITPNAFPTPACMTAVQDISNAISSIWSRVEAGALVSTLQVAGGTAPPGGPLAGGLAPLNAGQLTLTATFALIPMAFVSSFPPPGGTNMALLVQAVATALDAAVSSWVLGYSAPGVAGGGLVAWQPGPPPSPGPWSGGALVPLLLRQGASPGEAQVTPAALAGAITAALPAPIRQLGGVPTPGMATLIQAIATGFAAAWTKWLASTNIAGGVGTGTGTPPNGAISVGTIEGAKLL